MVQPGQLVALGVAVGLVGALTVASVRGALLRLPFLPLLALAYVLSTAFSLTLGWAEVDRGAAVGRPTDGYVAEARLVGNEPVRYLRHVVEREVAEPASPHPAAGRWHAPGRTLTVRAVDAVGASPGTAAAVVLALLSGLTVPLLLVAVRSFEGHITAASLLPMLVTLPGVALAWGSTDALTAAVGCGALAWGVTGAARRRGLISAAGAGLLLGGVAVLDYAMVWGFAAALACTYFARRRPLLNLVTASTALVPLAVFNHAGFIWPDGLSAARHQLDARPWQTWVAATLIATAVAAGPAVVGAAASLRRTAGWPLLVGGAVGVLASLVLGLARGGAERALWPAALMLVTASTATPVDRKAAPWLVGIGGAAAIGLAAFFQPSWTLA